MAGLLVDLAAAITRGEAQNLFDRRLDCISTTGVRKAMASPQDPHRAMLGFYGRFECRNFGLMSEHLCIATQLRSRVVKKNFDHP